VAHGGMISLAHPRIREVANLCSIPSDYVSARGGRGGRVGRSDAGGRADADRGMLVAPRSGLAVFTPVRTGRVFWRREQL